MKLLNESQKKLLSQVSLNESRQGEKQEPVDSSTKCEKEESLNKQNAYIRVVPDQKLLKLFVGQQSAPNSFQNVFLNLIPTNTTSAVQDNNAGRFVAQNPSVKDANRNVFLNINNTFQRFIPVPQNVPKPLIEDVNLSKILTESKTEELSVEIDPTDFGCMSEESPVTHTEQPEKDWEDLITGTKIHAAADTTVPRLVPLKPHSEPAEISDGKAGNILNNYVPILPKPNTFLSGEITNEEKYEFFNGGHFLTPKESPAVYNEGSFACELCDRNFDNLKVLRYHIKQFHLGKFPYKCDFCFSEFAARAMYDIHMEKHKLEGDSFITKESLTLQDFPAAEISIIKTPVVETPKAVTQTENGDMLEFACDLCTSAFSSANGLFRHKARKHNQKTKKKYFIKGMKNARCDICNRDFSTQSYLQLHKKLHLRNGPNYKGKIFKNKYAKTVNNDSADDTNSEAVAINDSTKITEQNSEKEAVNEVPKDINSETDCTENNAKTKSPQSIKIKINLKNLKQPSESMDDDSNSLNGNDEPEMDMETDDIDNMEGEDEEEEEDNPDFKVTGINEAPFNDVSIEYKDSATEYLYCLEAEDDEFSGDVSDDDPLKSETSILRCVYCKNAFDRMEDLKVHVNSVHIQSMQYKCHLCNNTFYEVPHLTKHLQIHFTAMSCTICQRMFSSEAKRQSHNYSCHSDTALWQCGVCFALIAERQNIKEHMLGHDCKLIYKCHFCDDELTDPEEFSKHVAAHNGLYSCNICEKNFNDEYEKNIHDNDVHKIKSCRCALCHQSYRKMHELTRHMNIHRYHPHLLEQKNKENENMKSPNESMDDN